MMKRVLLLTAAISLTACTTASYNKPMDAANASKLREAGVYVKADDRGVGVQYFEHDLSLVVPQLGWAIGMATAIASGAVEGMANAGPLGIAARGAHKLAPSFDHQQTSAQLNQLLQARLGQVPSFGAAPTIQTLGKELKWAANEYSEPTALLTSAEYSLTQDLRSLEVVLTATAVSKDAVKLRKHGNRKGKPDDGIVYRNRLEYRSTPLTAYPEKSDQQIDAEIAQIKAKYSQENQAKSDDRARANMTTGEREQAMKKAIARVHKGPPPDIAAEYYAGLWVANDAALLRNELQAGLAAVSDLLARDLQGTAAVREAAKPTRVTSVASDERVVSRVNVPPFKGSLVSEPVDYIRPESNAVAYVRKTAAAAEQAPVAGQ